MARKNKSTPDKGRSEDPFERIKFLAKLVSKATKIASPSDFDEVIDRLAVLIPHESLRSRVAQEVSRWLITTTNLHDSESTEIAEQIDQLDAPENKAFLRKLRIDAKVFDHLKSLSADRLRVGVCIAQMAVNLEGLVDRDTDVRADRLCADLLDFGLTVLTGAL